MAKDKSRPFPIRPLVSGAIVLTIAVYFLIICVQGLSQDYVEHGWQMTSGKVLDPERKLSGKKNLDRLQEGYEQTINYEYTVNSVRYESNSVSPELFVDKDNFTEGKIIEVYYNPNNITESVLIRRQVQKQYLWGMILFCAGVACFTVFNVVRDIRRAQR